MILKVSLIKLDNTQIVFMTLNPRPPEVIYVTHPPKGGGGLLQLPPPLLNIKEIDKKVMRFYQPPYYSL